MKNKSFYLNILANILMIIGLIMIIIPLISYFSGKGEVSSTISLFGIIIGLIGIFISKKVHKN